MTRRVARVAVPKAGSATVSVQGRELRLTNLDKPFWPELGITKGDLIQYYADVAPVLLPHIRERAMVMKRYPHGAHGEFFFTWTEVERGCRIEDFRLDTVRPRVAKVGDLWKPLLQARGRVDLNRFLSATPSRTRTSRR